MEEQLIVMVLISTRSVKAIHEWDSHLIKFFMQLNQLTIRFLSDGKLTVSGTVDRRNFIHLFSDTFFSLPDSSFFVSYSYQQHYYGI